MWKQLNNRAGKLDNIDYWSCEKKSRYLWFKQTVAATIIFALVYGLHHLGGSTGQTVEYWLRYGLTKEVDVDYIVDQVNRRLPPNIDFSVIRQLKTTMSKPADPLQYMITPVNGRLAQSFGWQTNPGLKKEIMHEGIDIEVAAGSGIRAVAPGKVKLVNESAQFGKTLILEHSSEVDTVYGYLEEVLVKTGDPVSQGQVIARVGKTGPTGNQPLLYFELRENGKPVDPLTRLKGDFTTGEGK